MDEIIYLQICHRLNRGSRVSDIAIDTEIGTLVTRGSQELRDLDIHAIILAVES